MYLITRNKISCIFKWFLIITRRVQLMGGRPNILQIKTRERSSGSKGKEAFNWKKIQVIISELRRWYSKAQCLGMLSTLNWRKLEKLQEPDLCLTFSQSSVSYYSLAPEGSHRNQNSSSLVKVVETRNPLSQASAKSWEGRTFPSPLGIHSSEFLSIPKRKKCHTERPKGIRTDCPCWDAPSLSHY